MKQLCKFCVLFFLCIHTGNAQQNTTKHKVSHGETILQIAKKYNVTPYDIQQANLGLISLDDLKENDVLIIPASTIKIPQLASASEAIKSAVASKTSTYIVKMGDTEFSLAKRFGVSVSELEALNPQIVSGLIEGQVLKVNGQVKDVPELSTDPAEPADQVISFEGYKTHLVQKDETLWSISHTYGLTVEQLVGENTEVLTGVLREGQTLQIPQTKQDAQPYDHYIVRKGDTKYGLSKKYETTIENLERLNPHIVTMLQVGQPIRIPSKEVLKTTDENAVVTATQTDVPKPELKDDVVSSETHAAPTTEKVVTPDQSLATQVETKEVIDPEKETIPSEMKSQDIQSPNSEAYVLYEIKDKETLYGLSKKAGMSIADFVVLNPQLKETIQIGTIIKMPKTATIAVDTSDKILENNKTSNQYADLSKTMNPAYSKKVVFFLPFSESDFKTKTSVFTDSKDESDTFKQSHLEFYSGAKMAIDSVKSLGFNINVTILEASSSKRNSAFTSLNNDSNLLNSDAIVMPFYQNVEEDVATSVAIRSIPVITASTNYNQHHLDNLFSALPSINQQRKEMLDYLISKQGNIVVVSDLNRSESKDFISEYVPTAKFIVLKKNGTFNEDELISNFKKDELNYVILDSERNSVFLNVTNVLLSELNSYSIQLAVLEQNLIPDNDDVSIKRYRILKMLFPSLSPVEENPKSGNFKTAYKNVYKVQPSTNASLGFDITFDTLLRLFQESTFEESAKKDITEYTKLTFDYEPDALGGYSNNGIFILQYDTNSNLQLAD